MSIAELYARFRKHQANHRDNTALCSALASIMDESGHGLLIVGAAVRRATSMERYEMMSPSTEKATLRLLDLFCGAGGAAMGYHRAGFEVVGVDIEPQPHYPFEFHQADAMTYPLEGFDVIHASPPCQRFSDLKDMHNALPHDDLLTPTRARLKASGLPFVIENVEGAPMEKYIVLCGTAFGLGAADAELRRHRRFEIEPSPLMVPPCVHGQRSRVIGVYGGHGRDRRRAVNTQDFTVEQRREAMGIDWMTGNELSQAIPPAYTEWIGRQLMPEAS